MNNWRRLREQAGLTRQELASKLAVNDQTVRRWEKDEAAPSLAYQRQMRELAGKVGQEGADA